MAVKKKDHRLVILHLVKKTSLFNTIRTPVVMFVKRMRNICRSNFQEIVLQNWKNWINHWALAKNNNDNGRLGVLTVIAVTFYHMHKKITIHMSFSILSLKIVEYFQIIMINSSLTWVEVRFWVLAGVCASVTNLLRRPCYLGEQPCPSLDCLQIQNRKKIISSNQGRQ